MNQLDFLPKEIEDIILDYKYQIEHNEKLQKCLKRIKINFIFKEMIKSNYENMKDLNNTLF